MKAIAALAIAALCVASGRNAQARPLADTVLVDQRGAAFTLRALRGEPVVLSFIATRCTDACPIAAGVFAQLARSRVHAQLVTISLDARYDTPFVMSRFAQALAARVPQWRVASGTPANVDAVLDSLGVIRIARNEHSTFVYCIDARGRIVNALPLSVATVREVKAWLAAPLQPIAKVER